MKLAWVAGFFIGLIAFGCFTWLTPIMVLEWLMEK
jgi:hypothetical protein